MTDDTPDEVGLPPKFRKTLSEILSHAAAQERTVIELRTGETASGRKHFTSALEITDHVAELEDQQNATPPER